jgi:hypothetical protein
MTELKLVLCTLAFAAAWLYLWHGEDAWEQLKDWWRDIS